MTARSLAPGLTGQVETIVGEADLASALGSGEVAVLGTPRMIALAEAATVASLQGALEPGMTSVGTRVDMRHLAATPPGRRVFATAELATAEGRALVFSVAVHDDQGLVGDGTVARAIVDKAKFEKRALAPRQQG